MIVAAPIGFNRHASSGGGIPAAWVIYQNFEGTGYDNGETWTESVGSGGTVDENYTTVALRGSQSLLVSGTEYYVSYAQSPSFTALSSCYFACRLRVTSWGTDTNQRIVFLNGSTVVAYLRIYLNGALWPTMGGADGYGSSGVVAQNQTYFCWIDYTAGTGANGVFDVYISSTRTKPETPNVSITTGTSTLGVTSVRLQTETQMGTIFDQVIVSSEEVSELPE